MHFGASRRPRDMIESVRIPDDWLDVALRLVGAVGLGAAVGLDREIHRKPAGLRTHAMVALGSALFVLVPLVALTPGTPIAGDALSRVIQGIVAGVGFIGAGAILQRHRDTEVKGITTASSIWVAAALGVAAGVGLWRTALLALGLCIVVLVLGVPLDNVFNRKVRKTKGDAE